MEIDFGMPLEFFDPAGGLKRPFLESCSSFGIFPELI